jgi:cell shape-determining protein MreC
VAKLLRKISAEGVLIALICMSLAMSLLGSTVSMYARRLTGWAFAPFGDAGMYVVSRAGETVEDLTSKPLSGAEARRLRRRVEALQSQLENYRTALDDLARRRGRRDRLLRALYRSQKKLFGEVPPEEFPWELVSARIVGTDSLPYGSGRMLNAGSNVGVIDGAKVTTRVVLTNRSKAMVGEKLATVSSQALAGEVIDSWAFGARLRLVTDRSFAVNALIDRVVDPNDPRTVTVVTEGNASKQKLTAKHPPVMVRAVGDGADGLVCDDVPEIHNVQPGDVLYTQESLYYLPARVRIGTVDRVEKQLKTPSFVTVHVKPWADLDSLRDVYVVVPSKPWDEALRGGG